MTITSEDIKNRFEEVLQHDRELLNDLSIFSDDSPDGTLVFRISYRDLEDIFEGDLDKIEYIMSDPKENLEAIKEVFREEGYIEYLGYSKDDNIRIAFTDLPKSRIKTPRELNKSKDIGEYLGLKGIAKKVGQIGLEPNMVLFECERCGANFPKDQDKRTVTYPLECKGCGKSSNKTNFKPIFEKSNLEDYQEVFIEEKDRSGRAGERPREEKAILWGDLVDSIRSGDEVILNGIYLVREERKELKTFFRVLDVEIENKEFDDLDITSEERERVEQLAKDPEIFDKIARSIAPSIRGCLDIKKSIALQFFKGEEKDLGGNHHRGDIHILLAGDPETGKSQIVDYASKISPRARKGSGRSTTSAGLIAGAVQDDSGNWYLEAGILPLADRGIACLDELDKMREKDRNSLHRAMEQQELSINKADIRLTLLTRTSILGACNPKEGRFTRREKVDREYMEDIRQVLGSALLSRFDSIWIITSDMTKEERKKRTRYISDLQREYGKKKKDENYKIPEDHKPSLDLKDLKNYIKLGRGITPELTNEALEVINSFIDDLSEVLGRGFIPRQHLALIRYAEASAKAHLREEVLPEDSKRAIELKKDELDRWKENGLDPKDYIEKVETGNTQKELTHKVEVMDLIKLIEDRGEAPTKEKIIEFSKQDDFEEDQISRTIEKLRHRGRIYEKNGVYKLS